ncbi:SGNH/GDSL hydrolase family protein [Flectobacillus major]|uniref:SGNH/GDSL hydrolase family protein n=1 Tax=Flectobacillus major TaxID=103 RepID=UPI001C54F917|nr:SGNH/GDSL hydrolase family protein [Flectobacillus major]
MSRQFISFFYILACLSCANTEPSTVMPSTLPNPMNNPILPKTFLALGDSYTIGESVPENDRWSVQLIKLLSSDFQITQHDIVARTGWTTDELMLGIQSRNLTGTYDMVSLLIGVNNQYRGRSLEQYRTQFRELLVISTRFAGNNAQKVMVLSIPDWGVTPFASTLNRNKIADEIDAFNRVALEECQKMGIVYIDITQISRTHNGDPSMIASDQLHFSGKMYALWASQALDAAKGILKK